MESWSVDEYGSVLYTAVESAVYLAVGVLVVVVDCGAVTLDIAVVAVWVAGTVSVSTTVKHAYLDKKIRLVYGINIQHVYTYFLLSIACTAIIFRGLYV